MYYNISDTRQPLAEDSIVEIGKNRRYIIDKFIGSGGFSLMYIAHLEGTSKYVALKELFPRHIEGGIAERRDDGKIVIYNPLTEISDSDNRDMWEEVSGYLYREVELAKKASIVYNKAGKRDSQNNPDVLHISDPFQDSKGNLYITIDTAQGEALADLINRGFVRNENGEVLTNGNLGEVLQILKDTARLLARLHGDNHMLHLDLSPDNIYLTRSGAGMKLTPHIIDYGSAYDLHDPSELTAHRFTCNPYSAPEVMALAELNDQNAGYTVDASSDTYAIVSILFYSLTGRIYSAEMLFNQQWKTRLRNEYNLGRYRSETDDSFVDLLIATLEKGLSSGQTTRYLTATELYTALSELQKTYLTSGNLLSKIEPDELMSYMVLDRYPLYAYRSETGDLDVLCLGSGVFVKRMILSMLSCGQMIGSHLNIHIVSAEPELTFKTALLAQAPALEGYSNLKNSAGDNEYVSFTYEHVKNLLQPEVCAQVAKAHAYCRYVLISLGSNNNNIDLALMYAKNISAVDAAPEKRTVINYYISEDAAMNVRAQIGVDRIPGHIELAPFGGEVSAYATAVRSLGRRTLRLSYLYDKLANPRTALEDTAQKFIKDDYSQRSSCASALHLKYKLASIGINLAPSTDYRAIISAYLRELDGPGRDALLELEHRRWMMYMIADGYRLPTMAQIDNYSFRETASGFNQSFKDTANKWHHCLVPCSAGGMRLPTSHGAWDQYGSYDDIDAAAFDPLDKMSLKVHLLAKERIADPATGKKLLDDLQNNIGAQLERRASYLAGLSAQVGASSENREQPSVEAEHPMDRLRRQYAEVYKAFSDLTDSCAYSGEAEKLELLEYAFREADIDASAGFRNVRQDLAIYIEFAQYRDYKEPDITIIDNLLWLLYADETMTLIKLNGRTVSDNITGPLILEPRNLIYFGMEPDECIIEFLRSHGNRGSISFEPCREMEADAIYREMERLRSKIAGSCAIDITGSGELFAAAAMRLALSDKTVSVIRSNENSQKIENVLRFHKAGAYRLNTSISAEEVYALYGARGTSPDNHYMLEMGHAVDQLWQFYQEFHDDWEMVTAFFHNRGRGTPELKFRHSRSDSSVAQWRTYTTNIDEHTWNSLRLKECFSQIEEAGVFKNIVAVSKGRQGLAVSFQYPGNMPDPRNDFMPKALNTFFSKKMWYALASFICTVDEDKDGSMYISVGSGSCVDIFDKSGIDYADKRRQSEGMGKRFLYAQVVPALKRLAEIGLIYDLSISPSLDQTPVSIKYAYTNLAVKDCLMTSGNILELYAWFAARQTGYFDDCRANLSFRWKEGVRNELDLILTKGLSTLVVSCKTAKFKKEHLYEIKYLTEQFSLNSKAVIVYSSTQAVDESGRLTQDTSAVKERAKAMGVYLIDMNVLELEQLGEVFVQISKGEYKF